MKRQQYKPVPRGYVRVWVMARKKWFPFEPRIFRDEFEARAIAGLAPGSTVTPLDIPAGALPGLRGGK